jgi:general secretion pathway protein E
LTFFILITTIGAVKSIPRGLLMTGRIAEEFSKYLLNKNSISRDLLSKLERQGDTGDRTLRDLWKASELSASSFADEVAAFYGLPRASLPKLLAATSLVEKFTSRFLREATVFPYQEAGGGKRLVMADPGDKAVVQATEIVLGEPVEIEVASFEDIVTVLSAGLDVNDKPAPGSETAALRPGDDIESLRDLASGAPVVRAVNDLLEKAAELRATDIHIEPFRSGFVVRLRVDGLLRAVPSPPGVLPQALISRIKILSGLNIAERRLPQDGAARLRIARSEFDVRVATMPTQHGESAVIRLLSREHGLLEIAKLGLSSADEAKVKRTIALPHGMIVVTGPTGSGKTTTLATILSALNETTRKILTIEDPVEYEIHGVNQTQVKPSIGLTFSNALRSFVRQDPDVIMVGEVRDAETADIAIHAALTGHLVLTTLHTETAPAAVPRLLDLGVEGFLLKSTMRGVIAQRLVRILCDRCKIQRTLTSHDLAMDPRYRMLGLGTGERVHEAAGCERCAGTGYRGRTGVFEIIEMTEDVRQLIGARADSGAIEQAAVRAGMTTMVDDAMAKCRAGVTSVFEVLRVTTVR